MFLWYLWQTTAARLRLCSYEERCLSLAFLQKSWCFTDFCCFDGGEEMRGKYCSKFQLSEPEAQKEQIR